MEKVCKWCKTKKPIECFYNDQNTSDKKHMYCKECCKFKSKEWIRNNKERCKARRKKYYEKERERYRENARKYYHANREERLKYNKEYQRHTQRNAKIKYDVMSHYGHKCICCGESEIKFLTIDHINNDGSKFKGTSYRKGTGLYLWIIKNGYPSTFQILCWNCNCAKGLYGSCPHKQTKEQN